MRILVDYRPALRERTGVGEYIHELARAYGHAFPDDHLRLFTSSWRDRPAASLASDLGAVVVDRRIPVRVLNLAWHRLEWPPIELLAGGVDLVHAAHPLLIPTRHAAQVITIHDLFFLTDPSRTRAEIRRDYAPLVGRHARRAHAIITSTEYGRTLVVERLGVRPDHVYVCPPGAPRWRRLGTAPNTPAAGTILFLGTLEPRKNVGCLLDAYERLLARHPDCPQLVLAGRRTPDSAAWLERIGRAPLTGHVVHHGYVTPAQRESLFEQARVLVLPSLDEGFGLTALEAMSAGVPAVVSNRGSLPEVTGGAAPLVDAEDADALAEVLERVMTDNAYARQLALAGLRRAADFRWEGSVTTLRRAYIEAVERRRG